MFCGTCGRKLQDDAKFCDNCGAVVNENLPVKAEPAVEVVEPIKPILKVYPKEQVTEENKARKKGRKKYLAVIAVVLVLAVAAAVLIPVFFPAKETIYVTVGYVEYDAEGNKTAEYMYEVNEFGNVLQVEYDSGDDVTTGWQYEYNEDYTYACWQYAYDVGGSVEYEYDEDGRIAEFTITPEKPMEETDVNMSEYEAVTYGCEYDEEGRLVRVYIPEGKDGFTTQYYEYDEDGRLIVAYYCSEEYAGRNEYFYKNGKLYKLEYSTCSAELFQEGDDSEYELVFTYRYDYDENGNLSEIVKTDDDGEEIYRREMEHTEDGILEEFTDYYPDGIEYSYEYTYDEYGNIIKVEYSNGSYWEYEYEAREVTPQQALYFNRRYRNDNWYFAHTDYQWDQTWVVSIYVPDVMREQE